MNNVEIYTDGAFASSKSTMGISFVVTLNGDKLYSFFDGIKGGTNNRAEVIASLLALNWLKKNNITSATIYTDSMYLVGTMTGAYQKKKNLDLWKKMDDAIIDLSINWKHVKGHNGDKWNSLCDILAVQGSNLNLE